MFRLKKFFLAIFFSFIFILNFQESLYAFIRDGAISGRSGLSFSAIAYQFDTLYVTIRNRNKNNVTFGGTMVFLDHHHKEIARAEIMPEKIKRSSSRRFKGVFTNGTGNEAKTANFLIWEF